ncbi:MAG: DNA circularization N-terminal domain-containing protein [Treponema sp.]|nr:DNA circularization N-terminal domain-containing protein [Treponema sp.]
MSTSKAAISFDSSLPRTYSDSWREAYGQGTDTPRLSSYQAPGGEPVVFAYDSIGLGGGQNVDTVEYPYGYWSNTRLGEKTHTLRIKAHVIGEDYIKQRSLLVEAFQVPTDDDNPGFLDLPLWGRFKVVVVSWDVDEEKQKNGKSDISLELKRAGYSDTKRFDEVSKNLASANVDGAVSKLKSASVSAFETAVEKSKDVTTLASGFGKISDRLAAVVGRVQGATSAMNGMMSKINGITNLIAQTVLTPRTLAQAFVSAAFEIVTGIKEIKNAASETASYFIRDDYEDDEDGTKISANSPATSSTLSPSQQETVMQKFISRNEKNVLMNFLSAATYTMNEERITEQQYNTVAALENLFKTVAFGVCVQLLTNLDSDKETYESQSGLWSLLAKLEDSIDKEDSAVFAAVEECRIACAEMLLSFSYDVELKRTIRGKMTLLELAMYLGCDADKIQRLNEVSDSFQIIGDVIYV